MTEDEAALDALAESDAAFFRRQNGGQCEDFPCCGHEAGDCDGRKYGSDEDIKAEVYRRMSDENYDPYYDDQEY